MTTPTVNKINVLMKAVVQSETDINILLRLAHNKRTFEMIKLAYKVFVKLETATAVDLVNGGLTYSSAYRLLVLMAENGLIVPQTLSNVNGSPKPSTAWRLT